jgi:hypothetical protein
MNRLCTVFSYAAFVCSLPAAATAQTGVRYALQQGTELTEEYCLPPCACPPHSITAPASGSFLLTLVNSNPLFDEYSITLVDWVAVSGASEFVVSGSGSYRIGGEVAITQYMTLDLVINDREPVRFESPVSIIDPKNSFPDISIRLATEQFICQIDSLVLIAGPAPCPADWNNSGTVTSQDFFDFLAAFFTGNADFNADGATTSQDFFDFLTAFFEPC